jgi:hypothetical protein
MMTAPPKLSGSLQTLLDDRLDAIDRVLLEADLPRSERQGIVEEVEAQVHELLGRCGSEPTRVELVAILDSLDPPEAYAPIDSRRRRAWPDQPALKPRRVPQPSLLALGSAMGGLLLLLVVVAGLYLVIGLEADDGFVLVALATVILMAGVAVSACGVFAIRQIRAADGWLIGLPAALFASLIFPLLAVNGLVAMTVLLFAEYGLIALAAIAVIVANACAVSYAWRWASVGCQRAATPVSD